MVKNKDEVDAHEKSPERKAYRRAYYLKNADKIKNRSAERRKIHPFSEYYWTNPERFREMASQRRRDNPEQMKIDKANRRARLKKVPGKWTAADIAFMMKNQKKKCAHSWCRRSLKDGYHCDHVIPLAKGGTNEPNNLQLLCAPCNLSKNAKHPIDFAQQNGLLL